MKEIGFCLYRLRGYLVEKCPSPGCVSNIFPPIFFQGCQPSIMVKHTVIFNLWFSPCGLWTAVLSSRHCCCPGWQTWMSPAVQKGVGSLRSLVWGKTINQCPPHAAGTVWTQICLEKIISTEARTGIGWVLRNWLEENSSAEGCSAASSMPWAQPCALVITVSFNCLMLLLFCNCCFLGVFALKTASF